MPNFGSSKEFVEYLKETLIPDLKEAGSCSLMEDFKEAIYWIERTNIDYTPECVTCGTRAEKILRDGRMVCSACGHS
jgi:hypothetical protein